MHSSSNPGTDTSPDLTADDRVGWSLLGGLILSVAVMVFGVLLAAIQKSAGFGTVLPLDKIPSQVKQGNAAAVLDLGIVLLFAIPLLGVLVALAEFARQRDAPFVLITTGLLVTLTAGFAIALR